MAKLFEGKKSFSLAIKPTGAQPLDDRTVVKTFADLLDENTFIVNGSQTAYNGMLVTVVNSQEIYMLIDCDNITSEDSWKSMGGLYIKVTYNELKELRDNSRLIPSAQYRITDYVATTVQENTQSANHQFDIIVTADDVNVLNENARAIQHTTEENDYFHNSNLAAWEIKYCLDNDTERFVWADATNGRGVIYYMKDEFNNECPYDFKNIQFARWELTNSVGYTKNANNEWVEDSNVTETYGPLKEGFCGLSNTDNNFTFGNSKFKIEYTISEEPTYCYTFGKDSDYSIDGRDYGNVIKKYKININKIQLNNIVFLGMDCINNTFGYKCLFNTFVYGCQFNTFGIGCSFNTFVHACQFNTFGNVCQSNTFGNECQSNTFGNVCQSNTFGDVCQSNTFGDECENNTFEHNCSNNTFGNVCQSNTFGNVCQSNTFGNVCQSNTFGDYCTNNTFGNYCYYNTFGDNCSNNTFGNECYGNTFGNYCYGNTFGNYCYYNSFRTKISTQKNDGIKDYCCYNCFEDGVQYVNIWNATTSSPYARLQNIRVKRGVFGTSSGYNHINVKDLGMLWEWTVASNSAKQIKQYCEADLIA